MKKPNWGYLVLAILFGVTGLIEFVRWSINFKDFNPYYLINFIPAIFFIGVYFLANRLKRKLIHFIAIPLCVLVIIFYGASVVFTEVIISSTTEVTDVGKYNETLDYWKSKNELVNHFPRPIPPDAQNIKFSYLPSFLQGGEHIQLRYSTSHEIILDLYKNFSNKKTKSFFGGNKNSYETPTTFFYTSGSENNKFPDDYEIMIFDKLSSEPKWNHGETHGVAISKKNNEIVYWAENW